MYHLVISGLQGQKLGEYRLQGGQGARIQALDQVHYQISDATGGLAPEPLQTARAGHDLLLYLEDAAAPALVIENYYLLDDSGRSNPLLGLNSQGQYVAYPLDTAPVAPAHLLAGETAFGSAPSLPALAGIAGLGIAAVALGGNRNGSASPAAQHHPQPQTPFDPEQTTPPAANPPADNGNTTPPPAPNPPAPNPPAPNPPAPNPPAPNPPAPNPPAPNPPAPNPPAPNPPAPNPPAPVKERGLNLDMARHFYTLPTLKAFVDTLAKAGGTFLHLHFSDNENYALESALLGQTTAEATRRADGVWINQHTQKPFLSSAQIAELVDYAQAKNIALVPELDMPAHIKGALDLLQHARGADYANSVQVDWRDAHGNPVHQLDVNRPQARALAKALLDEIAAHFKHARHIHIGGDEFHGAEAHNPEYIAFANDLAAHLAARGLRTRMWNDGILKTALAALNPDIEITYWNFDGDKQGSEAAHNRLVRASLPELINAGFSVLNYNNAYLYHLPEAHNYSSLSQSDHEMYTRLKEWRLGLWDGADSASAISDTSKIAGAAMSIWGDKAGALDDASIGKFTENQLSAIIRMINAEADPQSADAQALKTLQNALRAGDYSGMEHPVYLDLERAPQNGSLDTGALGTQHIRLLRADILDERTQFEFFIRGDSHDSLTLDNSWQASVDTITRQNPDYPADQVTYRAYTLGDDTLWIDQDLQLYWI